VLSVASLSLRFEPGREPLFRELSFDLKPGELLYVKGSNGSGKTSLLNCLSGIIPQRLEGVLQGSVSLNGEVLGPIPLRERYRRLAYQMSDPDHQLFFPTQEKELAFALENLGLPPEQIRQRITASAAKLGLGLNSPTAPQALSQGQKKLLLLAVCDALEPPLLLLDEPSSGLGSESLKILHIWLEQSLREGRIIILADHLMPPDRLVSGILDLDRK
jgi:energy-coupling factor transporter ATP-binding protein EcfA2